MAAEKSESVAPAATADTGDKKKGGAGALVPALLAIVLAPVVTFAVAKFVLIPQLRKELAAPTAAGEPVHAAEAPAAAEGRGKSGHGSTVSPAAGYTFENVVVNLAGSMGTRYLKTTFLVTGDPNIRSVFEEKKPVLVDVTINVLSSLSLADLEEAGSKNVIREKLVQSYNQTLGRKVAEQVFFSDFVVQ